MTFRIFVFQKNDGGGDCVTAFMISKGRNHGQSSHIYLSGPWQGLSTFLIKPLETIEQVSKQNKSCRRQDLFATQRMQIGVYFIIKTTFIYISYLL